MTKAPFHQLFPFTPTPFLSPQHFYIAHSTEGARDNPIIWASKERERERERERESDQDPEGAGAAAD